MDKPATPKIDQGELMILIGLVTGECGRVSKDDNRRSYYETLAKLREELMKADRSPSP